MKNIHEMIPMKNPLNFNELFTFDVKSFINKLKEYESYFKEEVEIVNDINIFDDDVDEFKFSIDTIHDRFSIELTIYSEEGVYPKPIRYLMTLITDKYAINAVYLTKQQYKKIKDICSNIMFGFSDRYEELTKNKEKAILQTLQSNQNNNYKLDITLKEAK